MPVNIICDFDGTIALEDVTDSLLGCFADDSWRDVEAQWLAGTIGSRDCMARQVSLIEANYESLNGFLDSVRIDPSFPAFVRKCREFDDLQLSVVSDGIDYAIKRILENNELFGLRVTANALVARPGNRYRLEFPYSKPDCMVQAGTCKCSIAQIQGEKTRRQVATILVGDGLSDVCLGTRADFVFAKDQLLEYCKTNAIPHFPFSTFADVQRQLPSLLSALDVAAVSRNNLMEISHDA